MYLASREKCPPRHSCEPKSPPGTSPRHQPSPARRRWNPTPYRACMCWNKTTQETAWWKQYGGIRLTQAHSKILEKNDWPCHLLEHDEPIFRTWLAWYGCHPTCSTELQESYQHSNANQKKLQCPLGWVLLPGERDWAWHSSAVAWVCEWWTWAAPQVWVKCWEQRSVDSQPLPCTATQSPVIRETTSWKQEWITTWMVKWNVSWIGDRRMMPGMCKKSLHNRKSFNAWTWRSQSHFNDKNDFIHILAVSLELHGVCIASYLAILPQKRNNLYIASRRLFQSKK